MKNIIKEFKEFLQWKKALNSFQKIDLNEIDKIKLEAFDKDLIRKLFNKASENLVKDLISGDLDRQYILGYKNAMSHILFFFKD